MMMGIVVFMRRRSCKCLGLFVMIVVIMRILLPLPLASMVLAHFKGVVNKLTLCNTPGLFNIRARLLLVHMLWLGKIWLEVSQLFKLLLLLL